MTLLAAQVGVRTGKRESSQVVVDGGRQPTAGRMACTAVR